MNFAFDEDQLLLRSSTRRFLAARHPIAAWRDRLEARSTLDHAIWREGAALGWTAMLVPAEDDGGSVTDQPVVDAVAVAEELGRALYPGPVMATNVVADVIAADAVADRARCHLGPIARGETVAAWCLTGDGSPDADHVEVAGEPVGGGLRLDGVARFVHDAHVADLLLVAYRTAATLGQVLVPLPAAGVDTRVLGGLDLTRRLCEVRFSGAVVDDALVVGSGPAAVESIGRSVRLATVLQAADSVGAAEALLERTVEYAKERVQFGRVIGSFQAIKHKLANMVVELEGARAATHYAALAIAADLDDRDEAVAVAGAYARDACAHVCGEALQIHGGIGFTWEHDVHLYVRRTKVNQLLHGDAAWHRERLFALVDAGVPEDAVPGAAVPVGA